MSPPLAFSLPSSLTLLPMPCPPCHCATICAPPMMSAHRLLAICVLSAQCLSGSTCHAHSLFTCTACPSLCHPLCCCLPLHVIAPWCNCPLPLLPLPQAVTLSLALSLCTIVLALSAPVASFSSPATCCLLSTPPLPSVPSLSPSPSFTPHSLPHSYPTLSPCSNLITCPCCLAVCLQHPTIYPCRLHLPLPTLSASTLSICTLTPTLSSLFYPCLPCSLSCSHPTVCSCHHLAICPHCPAVCPCCLCRPPPPILISATPTCPRHRHLPPSASHPSPLLPP